MRRRFLAAATMAATTLAVATLWPHAAAADAPRVHALEGARIVVAPGQVIERGTVVIRDGIVEAVGADVEAPADARVHDLEGLTVYPGLIDAYVTVEWPEAEADDGAALAVAAETRVDAATNPLVTPERDASERLPDLSRRERLRGAGFTTAVLAPQQGLFRGAVAIVNLGDGGAAENVLARDVAQALALRTRGDGGYPASLMGAEALLRQALYDARWYADAHAAYERDKTQARPLFAPALAALGDVAAGRERILIETLGVFDTLRWAHWVDEFGLDAIVVGNGEEYRRLDAVVAAGLPHVVPLGFPEAPAVSKESDDLSVSLEELRHWKEAPANPARLAATELAIAFTGHGLSDPKKVHAHLAQAIERGLSPDDALAGLTTVPAELFGLDDRLGTVAAGKIANLVIAEGELLVESPKLRAVWVDGDRYELKELKPAEVDPAGTWSMTVRTGDGQQMTFTLKLEGDVESLSGSIATPAGELSLSSVAVSGKTVEIELDSTPLGMPGIIQFSMTVEGESARGSGTAPPGPFTLTATRTSKPDPEVLR